MGSRDNSNEEAAVPAPPPELLEFVRRHIRNDLIDHSADRRKTEDINVVPAVVQPIDARYRTLGEPFAGVAHDGSSTDLGLVHDHATDSRLLAIEMRIAGEEVIAVAEVHWSRHLGPYHQLGGNFVAKLDHFPKPQDAMWFLTGKVNTPGTLRYVPIHTSPFIVGRRHDVSLYLSSKAVSSRHAELFARCNDLHVRDFGSTNGTFVNGEMVVNERRLAEGDLLQFGDVTLRVNRQMPSRGSVTAVENVWDQAMALKRFDDLLSKRNFSCCFQPIVGFDDVQPVAYEVLGRSRLFGLNSPQQMFLAAARLDRETELSLLLRREGIAAGQRLPGRPRLFVNTHPR
jgi:pSer/pThr/pTyr-binding forkhead associated (FHA) protein